MAPKIQPVFIVGAGRCGSAMLSNMLRDHPDVLSISEFLTTVTDLGGRIAHAFPEGSMNAGEVWSVLGSLNPRQSLMLRHGFEMNEMLYPLTPTSAFTRDTGVPAILVTTLPHLTPDHDALFAELYRFVMTLDPAPAVRHYERMFEWLQRGFDKRVWVERSGNSLRAVSSLTKEFPQSRFVHIVRDGRDCAISMSKHTGFRLMMACTIISEILGYDPFETEERTGVEDLPEQLYRLLPERFDPETLRNLNTPSTLFGYYWSGEMKRGLAALARLPEGRLLTIHYEDLLTDPAPWLRRLIEFIHPEFVDEDWVRRAATTVRQVPSSWRKLRAREQSTLTEACQSGFRALVEHGLGREAGVVPVPLFLPDDWSRLAAADAV
jgi:hypothetical protein